MSEKRPAEQIRAHPGRPSAGPDRRPPVGHPLRPGGNAIACGDRAVVVATGRPVIVTEVDHQTGRILARPVRGSRPVGHAGVDVEVTVAAHHPPLPDDRLEGLTIERARALLAPVASDNGR